MKAGPAGEIIKHMNITREDEISCLISAQNKKVRQSVTQQNHLNEWQSWQLIFTWHLEANEMKTQKDNTGAVIYCHHPGDWRDINMPSKHRDSNV